MASDFMAMAMLRSLVFLLISLPLVHANLPFGSIATPVIKTSDVVSFDPLSLLAVLYNPRASASAARLYAQPDRHIFRWPHMIQIGAVLAPVFVLVSHFTRDYKSIHPAVDMFMSNVNKLSVQSTIGRSINLFPTLPVCTSDSVVTDPLNFRPSDMPANDIKIVHLLRLGGIAAGSPESPKGSLSLNHRVLKALMLCTEIGMGLLISCGLAFSVLVGDMWAVALFGTSWAHWLSSTVVSSRQLVTTESTSPRDDATPVSAIYQRPSGGLVVFKGRQDTFERWARTAWIFNSSTRNRVIHWSWMLTGTAAAFASLVCMVNMGGYLQLGFIGMLIYSSVAELWLTVFAHQLQVDYSRWLGSYSTMEVKSNPKRYQSIIQVALGLDSDHRLDVSSWIKMSLLPDTVVFRAMLNALQYLNEPLRGQPKERLAEAKAVYNSTCGQQLGEEDIELKNNIWLEIERVWNERYQLANTSV